MSNGQACGLLTARCRIVRSLKKFPNPRIRQFAAEANK
jgi:hypothetical protein